MYPSQTSNELHYFNNPAHTITKPSKPNVTNQTQSLQNGTVTVQRTKDYTVFNYKQKNCRYELHIFPLIDPPESHLGHFPIRLQKMSTSIHVSNGSVSKKSTPVPGRLASVYSEVQKSRLDVTLPLPSVLRSGFKVVEGPPSSAAGNPSKICDYD